MLKNLNVIPYQNEILPPFPTKYTLSWCSYKITSYIILDSYFI